MTWCSFKATIEDAGVKDDSQVCFRANVVNINGDVDQIILTQPEVNEFSGRFTLTFHEDE